MHHQHPQLMCWDSNYLSYSAVLVVGGSHEAVLPDMFTKESATALTRSTTNKNEDCYPLFTEQDTCISHNPHTCWAIVSDLH